MDSDNLISYQSQDQNSIVHTVEVCGPQFDVVKNKIVRAKGSDEKYNRFGVVATTILTLITSITTLYTLIVTVWLTSRLQILGNNPQLLEISTINKEIILNQDVQVDSLHLGAKGLKFSQIDVDQVIISSRNPNYKQQPEIYLDQDSIVMQAKSYGSGETSDYSFLLSNKLNNLQVNEKITNIKLIRSPRRDIEDKQTGDRSNLEIVSKDKLELSGNLGLKVYSSQIDVNSTESIYLESKEDSLVLKSSEGLHLPNILTEAMSYNDLFTQDEKSNMFIDESNNNNNINDQNELVKSMDKKHQLCINSDNGRVYKQTTSGFC